MAKDIKAVRTVEDAGLFGYVCFYERDRVEVFATTTLEAQRKVAVILGVKEKLRYRISVHLCELPTGGEVVHIAVN